MSNLIASVKRTAKANPTLTAGVVLLAVSALQKTTSKK